MSFFLPCPLLREDGLCEQYEARPLICRFMGTSYLYEQCNIIKNYLYGNKFKRLIRKKEKIMVSVAYHENEKYTINIDTVVLRNGTLAIQCPYPLFYFFANDKLFEDKYKSSIELEPSKYANTIRIHTPTTKKI